MKSLKDARATADDVDLIIPHGLGIPAFDRAELAALDLAFGDRLGAVPVAPIKAQIGNLAAGSGVDAATAVLCLHDGKIPAAINTRKQVGQRKLNVSPEVREAQIDVAVSTVYSLGGQNASLVFKRISP
jgi:3-oxoacyl-(acyl-carrier-protein) synthase